MHLGTVTHMTILTTTIDGAVNGGTIAINEVTFLINVATDIDDGLVGISEEEVGYIPVAG
jgi:hypothetical protein